MSATPPPGPPGAGRTVAWAALLLAASNVASRALGLLREVAISGLAGATAQTDAYNAAFRLPDLLNHLVLGGAISLAFLPLYLKRQSESGTTAAERLLHTVLGTLTAAMALGTALAWVFAEPLVDWAFGGFASPTRALTVEITRIVLPAQILFAAGGVINATLLARNRFGALALAPLVYNLCIIGVGTALYPELGMRAFAWGVVLGAALGNFAIPLFDFAWINRTARTPDPTAERVPAQRERIRLGARVAPFDPDFRRYLWIALPFLIGVSLLTVDEWYHSIFGSRLAEGSVSHLNYARKLMLVPVGVIGQAISTAALPTLSRLWAERRLPELNRVLQQTIESAVFLAIVIAAGTALLSPAAVVLIYQRGPFTPEDSAAVWAALALFAIGIPAWITVQIGVRPFHARGHTWSPMLLQTAIAVGSLPLYWGFAEIWGVPGLAMASATSMAINAASILVFARSRHGAPALASLLHCALRGALVAGLATAATAVVLRGLAGEWDAQPTEPLAALGQLALAGPVYLTCAGCAALPLGTPMLRAQLRRVLKRP